MIFSSLIFLFWFMPIFFIIYYLASGKIKNLVLLIGSLIFYAWGEPRYLILLIVSICVNYLAGLLMEKRRGRGDKLILIAAIVFDISMLFFFKYVDFFITNINGAFGTSISKLSLTLPLGISFYTFQIMSYVIDLYRGKVRCEKSIINLATYLCMFPQLIAGPIVVYSEVSEALSSRKITMSDVEEGLEIFILGLGSKVLIANNVGMLWDEIKILGYDSISMPLAWMGMIAYSLQIYFDFNGYSMMAIGLGKMLGFTFPKNFNLPYVSKSITEYWRRWHITLSGWFREYLYIPLGGNRKGKYRTFINLFIVWFVTGFWHGADWNFILWGLYFFVLLMVEKSGFENILSKNIVFARLYTLFAIGIGWIIFAITDISSILVYITRVFSFDFYNDFTYYLRNYGVIILLGVIFSSGLVARIFNRIDKRVVKTFICMGIFVVSVAYLADASYNPFLYFRF